jgi:hypothetical protein
MASLGPESLGNTKPNGGGKAWLELIDESGRLATMVLVAFAFLSTN